VKETRGLPLLAALLALSAVGLAVRVHAARSVGFGDSEALYACYALYPAPAYLDHPGLIGLLARGMGHGTAPSPLVAHVFTALAATLAPWWAYLAARLVGGDAVRSLAAALAVAVAPEIAVGLFGMTPDLPFFFAWVGALALLGRALLSPPGGTTAAALFVGAGVAMGVACASKVSGLALVLAALITLCTRPARAHARTAWPWAGLCLAAVVFAPVVAFEARAGWPMLRHRLVDTQHDAGLSVRNAAALVLGQAAYVSPILLVCGLVLGRDLVAAQRRDAVHALLASATVVPLVILGSLCLWSRVAEPHWIAPAWLPLPLYYALRASPERPPGPRLRAWGLAVGLSMSAIVYAWVLVPAMVALVPRASYDPRLDLANELSGWPEVAADVTRTVDAARVPPSGPEDVVVVGSVWTVCAQLRAALPASVPVGCAGSNIADFATWSPSSTWSRADILVLVHDSRAPADRAALFPDRSVLSTHTLSQPRGDRTARVFTIEVLSRRATALEPADRQAAPPESTLSPLPEPPSRSAIHARLSAKRSMVASASASSATCPGSRARATFQYVDPATIMSLMANQNMSCA
jgi:hypothetical protein